MENLSVVNLQGVECYEKENVIYLKLETVARGLGFTQERNGVEYVRWETVFGYLKKIFSQEVGKDDFIPENVFYRLAMKAKNEAAEKFQALVADEIIPSIRKNGGYIYTSPEMTNEEIMARAMIIANAKIEELNGKIQELLPKAEYFDDVLHSDETLTTTQVAKDYCISAQKLNSILYAEGIQFKVGGKWNLYAKYANQGLAINQTLPFFDCYGNKHYNTYLCWTQKGREFIKTIMEKRGIKPHEDL